VQRNFCRTCGTPWEPTWEYCVPCFARAYAPPLAQFAVPKGPSVVAALALYFALLAASAVGLVAAAFSGGSLRVEFIISIVHTAIVMAWCAYSWKDVLPALARPVAWGWFPAALGLAVLTFLLAAGAVELLQALTGIPELKYTPPFFNAGYGWGMVVLLVCVQPGVIEELAFRGVIQSALGRVLAPREAIAVGAMLFMALHLTPPSFPHLLVIGLVLGYLRHRTGSLLPGMLMHFTHNLLCVAAEVALG
jgi:sodium transport system permease protein